MTFYLAKLLKRDPRMVERKKTGRAKARKAVRCFYLLSFVPSHIRICRSTLGSSVDVVLLGAARGYLLQSYNVDACCLNLRIPALVSQSPSSGAHGSTREHTGAHGSQHQWRSPMITHSRSSASVDGERGLIVHLKPDGYLGAVMNKLTLQLGLTCNYSREETRRHLDFDLLRLTVGVQRRSNIEHVQDRGDVDEQ